MAEDKRTEKEKWDEKKKRIEAIDEERIKRLDEEEEKHSSLGDKIIRTLKSWVEKILDVVIAPFGWALNFGLEKFFDIMGDEARPFIGATIDRVKETPDLPPDTIAALDEAKKEGGPIPALIGVAILGGIVGGMIGGVMRPMGFKVSQQMEKFLKSRLLDPRDAAAAIYRGIMAPAEFDEEMLRSGYSESRRAALLEVNRELLREDDLRDAFLRGELSVEDLTGKLRARGYIDADIDTLKKLHWIIPTQTDLVRMAVREVFTPEVVAKFGQMEDFPPAFAEWAGKIGLSEEWAKNYWAAHWDLPSTTQAFEMFHRGVIDEAELHMLLRALDIMPFWRDKLTEIAFRPYTRVDVRRMHKVGILDDAGVKRAYLDLGYDDEKATAMTEFTIAYNAKTEELPESEEIDWTRTEIVDAFRRGVMSETEARDLLKELDYSEERIDFYIKREELKREQDLKGEYLKRYKTLYVEGMIGWSDVGEGLLIKGFVATELEPLQEVWDLEKQYRVAHPSRADLDPGFPKGSSPLKDAPHTGLLTTPGNRFNINSPLKRGVTSNEGEKDEGLEGDRYCGIHSSLPPDSFVASD